MTATAPIRWACAKRLIEQIRQAPALTGVQVEAGFPGDKNFRAECIWLDEITGDLDTPVITALRRHIADEFTLPIQFRVAGRRTLDAAMERISELLAAAYDPIVDGTSTLDELDGVVSALPGTLLGPVALETPSDGVLAFARWDIDVHARLA